jgi:hypothetical protein
MAKKSMEAVAAANTTAAARKSYNKAAAADRTVAASRPSVARGTVRGTRARATNVPVASAPVAVGAYAAPYAAPVVTATPPDSIPLPQDHSYAALDTPPPNAPPQAVRDAERRQAMANADKQAKGGGEEASAKKAGAKKASSGKKSSKRGRK